MRNRWFHAPTLHTALHEEKTAGWIELFYDLIFVAAFIQLGNGLAHNLSVVGFLSFAAVFTTMWTVWTGMTFYINRFNVDDFVHRAIVFVQMFSVGAMAISAPAVLDGDPIRFAIAYAVAQLAVSVLYFRAYYQVSEGRAYARYWGRVFGISALLWGLSVFVPPPYTYGVWAVAQLTVFWAPFSKHSRALNDEYPWDEEHLSERYGLLTLIVLGESFVKVLTELTRDGSGDGLLQASFTLLITCCLWWIYFDDVAGSKIRRQRLAPLIWLFAHLPLQIAVTATGVGIKKIVSVPFDEVAGDGYRWLICAALALALFSVSIVDSVTERRQAELSDKLRVNVRISSAVLILLLAPAGAGMSTAVFVGLLTTVCVGQVIFDMMMAPLEAEADHVHYPTLAELHQRQQDGEKVTSKPRKVRDAVRKGTPSELRRDVYFYFMEGGWGRYLGALLFVYLMLNVTFATLYFLEPGCIDGSRPDSFSDAFFFSVQTLSTIGYGAMSPVTDFGHTIVACEAALGMMFIAVVTGLTFAKVSRPKASVLFSKNMVITKVDGKRTLIFRAGNARGNEIVDAAMSVTVLKDEVSAEGRHWRRLHDLELTRARNPFFSMTWVIMHTIDESSPLWNCDLEEHGGKIITFIVTLIGHDGTYGQTVHARTFYEPDAILPDRHFVDVISQLPDDRLMIDYTKFHDTLSDAE